MTKAFIAIAIGIGCLIAAIFTIHSTRDFLRSSVVVPGRVIALNAGGSHPQIAFVTQSGEAISYPQGGMIFGVKIGDAVQVRYLPETPRQSATLDRFGALWDTTLFLAVLGSAAIVCGLRPYRRGPRF
jgi:Protein of unknown function (DUF3592)